MATQSRPKAVSRKPARKTRAPKKPPKHSNGGNLVQSLREQLGFNRKNFSRLTGFSERAIADWEANKPLSEASRQRMREMTRLRSALANVMREDFIGEWLNTPNEGFAGLKPLEVVERGEIDRLWRMIYRLESGTPT